MRIFKNIQGVPCQLLGVALHFMIVAVFLAMFIESLNLYLALVLVFGGHVSHILLKVIVLNWGERHKLNTTT